MTQPQYYFPFGKPLEKVEQTDRTKKKAFVLGVYASAVHAKWLDPEGNQKIASLAVASEPTIFWTGENAEQYIPAIPQGLGTLVPANANLNGPSGRALDSLFLKPLGLDRSDAWLCDLLPESRTNQRQRDALAKNYTQEIILKYKLKPATIPNFHKRELDSEPRHQEILQELETSQAETLILLGDYPITKFLNIFADKSHAPLSGFGDTPELYGKSHDIVINDKHYNVIPLCHPRQAARLARPAKNGAPYMTIGSKPSDAKA